MKRVLALGLLVAAPGCATFETLSPKGGYTEPSKGIWLAKSSSFLGVRFASQEVLFCHADNHNKPVCFKASGDVEAASIKESANKASNNANDATK
jgi:hypothetical protein